VLLGPRAGELARSPSPSVLGLTAGGEETAPGRWIRSAGGLSPSATPHGRVCRRLRWPPGVDAFYAFCETSTTTSPAKYKGQNAVICTAVMSRGNLFATAPRLRQVTNTYVCPRRAETRGQADRRRVGCGRAEADLV